jgi:hypothetical protein
LDNFDDRYLGAKTSDPALDNDGNALVLGALYFNSTDGVMKVYTASGWIAASSASVATLATFEFVATAGQTVFTGNDANGSSLSYVAPAIIVTLNGVRLRPGDDYTATNGTSITLISAAALNDELVVDAFGSFLVANTYTIAQTDAGFVAVTGNQSIAGNKNFASNTLYVDDTNDRVGVGTASPQEKFHVSSGAIRISNTSNSLLELNTNANNRFGYLFGTSSSLQLAAESTANNVLSFSTDNAERMRIDSSGRITTPFRPAFVAHATGNSSYTSVAETVPFPANTANYNQGSCFNTSNYRFTAPVTGLYLFAFSALNGNTSAGSRPTFFVNGSSGYNGIQHGISNQEGGGSNSNATSSLIYLQANDYVFVASSAGSLYYYGQGHSTFSGCLIG